MKRFVVGVCVLAGLMASAAFADVKITAEVGGVMYSQGQNIPVSPGPVDVTFFMEEMAGSFHLGGLAMDLSGATGLGINAWEWRSGLDVDPYLTTVILPTVIETAWGGAVGGGLEINSVAVPVGMLTLTYQGGTEQLPLGPPQVFDSETFSPRTVASGNSFTFVPEPASLSLLVLGAMFGLRRRR